MIGPEEYTAQNRRGWDEIAALRQKKQRPAEYFADGGCQLDERILAVTGDVRGLRLCHLQCATGEDTLSWANRGAEATGVDISPRQIRLAKEKAALAGLCVRFVSSDIYELPQDLRAERFDIVFTGGGSLVWLPDLSRWAQTVATLLKPSGQMILEEEHPLVNCMGVQDGQVRMLHDYFGREPEVYKDWTHFPGGENATEDKYNFTWPLGDNRDKPVSSWTSDRIAGGEAQRGPVSIWRPPGRGRRVAWRLPACRDQRQGHLTSARPRPAFRCRSKPTSDA